MYLLLSDAYPFVDSLARLGAVIDSEASVRSLVIPIAETVFP